MDARALHSNHIIIFVVNFLQVVMGAGPIDRGITVTTRNPIVGNWTADKAVDGDATRTPHTCDCCAFTQWVYQPMFHVDLGKEYNISRVDVIGRGGPGDVGAGTAYAFYKLQVLTGITNTSLTQLYYNIPRIYIVNIVLSDPLLVRYLRLKQVNHHQNLVVCELYVYAECNNGTYSPNCDECGHCLNGEICDKEDGACVSCEAGFKGARCDHNCSPGEYGYDCAESCGFCNNGDVCDRINGTCTDCQDGYMLPYCKECNNGRYSPNCDECGHCLNGAMCNKEDGACVSCEAGYKGARCDQNCPAGEYGYDCAEACGFCKNGDGCDRINGTCIDCQDGYMLPYCKECAEYRFGENCTRTCLNCAEGPCNKTSGVCPPGGCIEGYKGARCDTVLTCQHCAGGLCNKTSGVCPPGGCRSGYKGAMCDTECDAGTYGLGCNENCGSCYNRTCNNIDGTCPQSHCEAGFRGDLCKQICAHGSYGQNCSKTCGYCTNGETCDPITGVCLHGCSDGYNGTLCKTTCPSGTFGKDCNSTCGNCINGDVCRFDNGHCERGCESGLQSPMCLSAPGPESSSSLSSGEIAGSAVGGIFIITLIVVAVIFVYRQRRKKYGPREQATESSNG